MQGTCSASHLVRFSFGSLFGEDDGLMDLGLCFRVLASYANHVKRFEISLEKQAFPKRVLLQLEQDASEAYPSLTVFQRTKKMYPKLREFMGAWVVVRLRRLFCMW